MTGGKEKGRKKTEKDDPEARARRGIAEKRKKKKTSHRVHGGGTQDTEKRVYN
jgi:hypothetical protein